MLKSGSNLFWQTFSVKFILLAHSCEHLSTDLLLSNFGGMKSVCVQGERERAPLGAKPRRRRSLIHWFIHWFVLELTLCCCICCILPADTSVHPNLYSVWNFFCLALNCLSLNCLDGAPNSTAPATLYSAQRSISIYTKILFCITL